jgi:hypothetical protein
VSGNHARILKALRAFMRPLAECLLQAGIGYREFESVSKLAFAETAFRKFGVRGRLTNVSRAAAMTGISRKELSKLRLRFDEEKDVDEIAISPSGLVLAGWYTDRDFTDDEGKPRVLQFEGDGFTFATLVRRYAGDVPAGALRTELKRSLNIEELEDNALKVLRRHFVPPELVERLATSIEVMLGGLAATIAHNTTPSRVEQGFIERFVYSDRLRPSAVPAFRQVARDRAQDLLERLDDWLAENDVPVGAKEESPTDRRVGLGLFYYEGPNKVSAGGG